MAAVPVPVMIPLRLRANTFFSFYNVCHLRSGRVVNELNEGFLLPPQTPRHSARKLVEFWALRNSLAVVVMASPVTVGNKLPQQLHPHHRSSKLTVLCLLWLIELYSYRNPLVWFVSR